MLECKGVIDVGNGLIKVEEKEKVQGNFPKIVGGFELVSYLGGRNNSNVFVGNKYGRMAAIKIIKGVNLEDLGEYHLFINENGFPEDFFDHNIRIEDLDNLKIPGSNNEKAAYVRMELLQKGSLGKILVALRKEGKTMDLEELLLYISHAAKGLQKAHEQDIYHMDIHPENIGITIKDIAKLMDFSNSSIKHNPQSGGTVKLRPMLYNPPERFDPEILKYDKRTDIYLLGATLHEVLTGRPPYKGINVEDNPKNPKKLNSLVYESISPNMGDRPIICEFIKDLDKIVGGYNVLSEEDTLISKTILEINKIVDKLSEEYDVLGIKSINRLYRERDSAYNQLKKLGSEQRISEIDEILKTLRERDTKKAFEFASTVFNDDYYINYKDLDPDEERKIIHYHKLSVKWCELTREQIIYNNVDGEIVKYEEYTGE